MFVLNLLSSQLILLLPFSYSYGAWFQDPLPSKKSSDLLLPITHVRIPWWLKRYGICNAGDLGSIPGSGRKP